MASLPPDLEAVFNEHPQDQEALLKAFMPVFCDHVRADRIFLQPRNPSTRVCKILRWRRTDSIPWPAIPGDIKEGQWFIEDNWENEDPLWRAALQLKPSIYVEDLEQAARDGILNLDFERNYMFHTALIHAHAHWPPLQTSASLSIAGSPNVEDRWFYGSVQPAVFDGPRVWSPEIRDLVEKCLVRIAPVMKAYGERAPPRSSFEKE
ncbi:uncharacterized protein LY89DRAFT_679182 [Mollisia scopiformis]|uniref:Uncharacterized protein n=1 Tax=Mollisia scopiformis TaxID=149040 RepID=A0A194XUA4_MOLSC|nr:uncharacterized protein LY89DRAFT_679182 [Mollisia scopiformis]KUJ23900.1 hypothetical protein LY89DRAFT_679182 [Mollisia scopiformis]